MGTNTTSSYLDPPTLYGVKNADGTYTLSALEIKKLNDYNYYVAKMIQGGLNLANLNEETNQTFTDTNGNVAELALTALGLETSVSNISGDVSTLEQTASGLTTNVSNLSGAVSTVSQTVNGLGVTTSGGTTYITGDHIKTGTIEGVRLISKNGQLMVDVDNGTIQFSDNGIYYGEIYAAGSNGVLQIRTNSGVSLKLISDFNMAIDSSGTIYIGTSAGQSGNVDIGQTGGTVNLIGTVLVNGAPI